MSSVGTREFRETTKYKKHYDAFGDKLRQYLEYREDGKIYDGLEPLMVEAHRFMSFIRKAGNILLIKDPVSKHVDHALDAAISILDEPIAYCMPLHFEADALETFSYSAWKCLVNRNYLKHCKKCSIWCDGTRAHNCKKDEPKMPAPQEVPDLVYCRKCSYWGQTICVIHGAEACQ